MGTRGTLRVYLDGKLKIRQYNQWDSYPTGQVGGLVSFLASERNRKHLIAVLRHLKFYTEAEADEFSKENGQGNMYEQARFLYTTNRDWGYKILYLLCLVPQNYYPDRSEEGEQIYYKLADWADVFGEEDLDPQEGNYVIELHSDSDEFCLKGDWHDVKREFYNELPTESELQEWENEGNSSE